MLFSLFVIGCSGSGESANVATKHYQLYYNSDHTAIDGNIKISIDDIVNSPNMSQTVEVRSFVVEVGDCPIKDYTVTSDSVTFTDETAQDLAVHVDFACQCFGNTLTLTAAKVVTTKYPNVNTTDISESIWSETYDLKSETGEEVESDELVVSRGLLDQDSLSICISSESLFNPEAWGYNGETVLVTILAADRFNNPVPDGLSIYFTTEGGAIEPFCTTVNGSCTVEWRSQNPRPDDGRVTILATAIGEESFTDINGNGRFDSGDKDYWDKENSSQGNWNEEKLSYDWYLRQYKDLPDAFLDNNKNGVHDDGEEFFDFDGNNECKGNGIYNGLLCTDDAEEQGICTKELVHVRDDIVIVMSGSYANIVSLQVDKDGYRKVTISVSDYKGNSMPGGTKVDVETTNGTIVGETSFEVLNITEPLEFEVTLEPGDDDEDTVTLIVTVTTPKGHETTKSIVID